MKRRITFLYDSDSTFDPQQLQVEKKSVQIKSLKAAREERWTTNLYDLPQEVWKDGAPYMAVTECPNSYGWL